ncbi:MAG: LCP family protein [Patescibacteria group bacterium]
MLALFFMLVISFFAYIYAQGTKIFEDGFGAKTSIFRNIRDSIKNDVPLKGEKDERINILFMGIGGADHPGGQLTDSIMIASFKPEDNSMALLSVPRDLYVPVADHKIKTKINEVVALGEREKRGSGLALMNDTIEDIFDIPVHYYVTVDFEAFEKIVDEVGGIDVAVDKTIYDPYYPDKAMKGYEPFYVKAGQHHMNGEIALKYARSRQTSSDFDRAERQQKIIMAIKDKILSLGFIANPKKSLDMATILGDHVRTNIQPNELRRFAEIMQKVDSSKVANQVLTNGSDGPLVSDSSSGTYYLMPRNDDYSSLAEIAKNIFDDNSSSSEKATLEVLNGSSVSGQAIKLADTFKDLGYKVVNIANAEEIYKQTVIHDYTKGAKSSTLEFLKKRLDAPIIDKTGTSASGAEIVIIIGQDYLDASSTGTSATGNSAQRK